MPLPGCSDGSLGLARMQAEDACSPKRRKETIDTVDSEETTADRSMNGTSSVRTFQQLHQMLLQNNLEMEGRLTSHLKRLESLMDDFSENHLRQSVDMHQELTKNIQHHLTKAEHHRDPLVELYMNHPADQNCGTAEEFMEKQKKARNRISKRLEKQSEALGKRQSEMLKKAHTRRIQENWVGRLVLHSWFDFFILCAIFVNALILGLQINHEAISDTKMRGFWIGELVCTVIFTAELMMRIYVYRCEFFSRRMRLWAVLDTGLVVMSLLEIALSSIRLNLGNVAVMETFLKNARMVRCLRLVRIIRFIAKVRVMVTMILSSLGSLFWLFILMLGIIYIFAIVLTQGATEIVNPIDGPPVDAGTVSEDFGNIGKSMYTLFKAMCGGVSWGEPGLSAQKIGTAYFIWFMLFIFFTFFSVLNIVTGVFVDGAIQQANSDRALLVDKTLDHKKTQASLLKDALAEIDLDGDGKITEMEWERALEDERVVASLQALEVTPDADLWSMLDIDGSGDLQIEEFLDGIMRLKGMATAMDVHRVMVRLSMIQNAVQQLPRPKQLMQDVKDAPNGAALLAHKFIK
eukprot:TRINITY_DN56238_c0_g1_i1.p1 TRINITY_DN56238_c0_g1~~TRINITY_DN56238_c0_g1_i1.p1  ORF type:complete len:576 (-),score=94.78 TRINITY_DN56238_c0_g1_i1:78-1805(-)